MKNTERNELALALLLGCLMFVVVIVLPRIFNLIN